ncbi:hypothetical protein [Cyclobacterium marinum]|uniref:Lipoprotein n=3 Tax=Cyclobacterium TaxID=68288 RepID=G0J7T9_CYCMS|nr:hypothetical protein [Cyclobacterium marinum]AEL27787.1 hypothetical protein Cycma_4081 [Cyclobacterium marinum DSM 745]
MLFRYFQLSVLLSIGLVSCNSTENRSKALKEMEFVKVDSLVFDELQILNVLDYHREQDVYLMVTKGVEGRYFIINSQGEVLAEELLSEGPNAFGMVLHRAGFVGDEIMFVSDQEIFVYDLDLQQLRKFPFEQHTMVRMIHTPLDNFHQFSINNVAYGIANLSDRRLDKFPMNYFDTLNYFHLVNPKDGTVIKGGKIDESSIFKQNYFYPGKHKPIYFSDLNSKVMSLILPADSILFQYDQNLNLVNKIKLEREEPDQLAKVPMEMADRNEFGAIGLDFALGGGFTHIVGQGDAFIVEYKAGLAPEDNIETDDYKERMALMETRKIYYYPIEDGILIGLPVLWDKPGNLKLGLGKNRYLHYADQADIHEEEKEYQCYYIYELRPVEEED